MGRMLEALRHEGRGLKDKPFFEDSLEREPHAEAFPAGDENIPFIEIGGGKKLEASPQVMAAKVPAPARIDVPHHPEKKPLKADLSQPQPLTVAFEPWPCLPRIAQGISAEIVAFHHPEHPVSQQYASLVEKMGDAAQPQVLLLVGSKPQVGTSTVLLNLAVSAALQAKRRVVVIDAHLRRPGLAQRLGYAQAAGLQDVLQGKLALEQAVVRTSVSNLHLIPAQVTTVAPALSAEAVRWLFAWVRDRFDFILVDGPALDTGGELAAVAPCCDGAYLVLPQGENPQIQRTLAQTLTTMGARLRGLIHTHCEM